MRIYRCPRCRAEDIAADAHPTRILDNGIERVIFVCRNCYRAAELEFRIASQAADLGYVPLERATALAHLAEFYRERLREYDDPDVLMDDTDRFAATARIRAALDAVTGAENARPAT